MHKRLGQYLEISEEFKSVVGGRLRDVDQVTSKQTATMQGIRRATPTIDPHAEELSPRHPTVNDPLVCWAREVAMYAVLARRSASCCSRPSVRVARVAPACRGRRRRAESGLERGGGRSTGGDDSVSKAALDEAKREQSRLTDLLKKATAEAKDGADADGHATSARAPATAASARMAAKERIVSVVEMRRIRAPKGALLTPRGRLEWSDFWPPQHSPSTPFAAAECLRRTVQTH